MNLKEWLDEVNVRVSQGYMGDKLYSNIENVIGKEVWICDYRLGDDKFNKPIRNIPPKLVKAFNKEHAKKNIYYSPVFFKEIRGSKVLATEIAPYDNTGYRSYTGVSLNIFNTKEECEKHYKKQLMIARCEIEETFSKLKDTFNDKLNFINNELLKYE